MRILTDDFCKFVYRSGIPEGKTPLWTGAYTTTLVLLLCTNSLSVCMGLPDAQGQASFSV